MQDIVVIQTAFLGDVILTTSLLEHLKKANPKATIYVLTTSAGAAALSGLERVVPLVYDKRKVPFFRGLREIVKRLLSKARVTRFDLVVAVHRSFRSSLLAAMIPAKKRVSFATLLNRLLAFKTVPYPAYSEGTHYSMKTLKLLEAIDNTVPLASSLPKLSVANSDIRSLEKKIGFSLSNAYCVLSPFSVWGTKMWLPERFAELGALVSQRLNLQVIICGEPLDEAILEAKNIFKLFESLGGRGVNLVGQTTVSEMIALIAGAKTVVANDSAPVHVASSFNVPTVAIFGPTVRRFGFFPLSERSEIVERAELSCRPCSLHGPLVCPQQHFKCMREIQVEDVFKAVQNVTRGTSWSERH